MVIAKMKFFICCLVAILNLFPSFAEPTEEYAEHTGLSCEHCHLDSSGGGELTEEGEGYLEKLMQEPGETQQGQPPIKRSRFAKYIRFIAGWLHIFTAIFWFGTILYVHLILKPAYAAHGLPRGEVIVGLVSMMILGATGLILAHFRMTSLSLLFETRFGILLLIKIAIFLVMVSTALFVVLFLGPKLKPAKRATQSLADGKLTIDELKAFDGTENRAAHFSYQGKIYDVSENPLWRDGVHFVKHRAGEDLTEFLKQAPHGEEKIIKMPQVGELAETEQSRTVHEKVFYFLAYFNLMAVVLITIVLALWRWW